jgi:hypothetical protein
MKPGAPLINVAQAAFVAEDALYAALENGGVRTVDERAYPRTEIFESSSLQR